MPTSNSNETPRDEVTVELTPPMRPFTASLPMALLRARETAMRLFRPMLAEHDLTEQQWRVLRALTATSEPIDAGEIASRTFLLAASLSRILVNLHEREFIRRWPDPSDQRRILIELTDVGRETVTRIAPESELRYLAIENTFGAERLGRLLSELHDLAALDVEIPEANTITGP